MTPSVAGCSLPTLPLLPLLRDGGRSGAAAFAKAWNAYQLRAFLDHTAGHRMHTALWTAANTGMRRSELAALHWGDIDLDERLLSVNRSLVSVGYELHEARGKTRTSRRCIDLDSATVQILRDWQSHRAAEDPAFDVEDPDAYVFARPDGTRVHPQLISDAFKRKVRTSGLPRVRLHDLRHTHATLLLKAGVPIKVVSERLGHSSPAFTMAAYQHVLPGMQHETAETFASLLELLPDVPAAVGLLPYEVLAPTPAGPFSKLAEWSWLVPDIAPRGHMYPLKARRD